MYRDARGGGERGALGGSAGSGPRAPTPAGRPEHVPEATRLRPTSPRWPALGVGRACFPPSRLGSQLPPPSLPLAADLCRGWPPSCPSPLQPSSSPAGTVSPHPAPSAPGKRCLATACPEGRKELGVQRTEVANIKPLINLI